MNDYSDEDLLMVTSFKNENEKEAQEAFTIFYNRHKQYLWNLCHKVCRNSAMAEDVMQNTWMAIYKYGHSYNANKSNVKTWMARIAKNEMFDLLKGEPQFIPLNEDMYSIPNVDVEEEISISSHEKKVLEEALNKLSEKEKDILLIYMQYSDGNRHLPDEVLNELRQGYNTTSESLRQIKKRTLDKVKNYITLNKSVIINKTYK